MLPGSCDRKDAGVAGTVERICASPGFRRSARLQRFLRFLASTQAALGCSPKEYEIAREVYDKPEDFNPQTDPIVRVEASRLRLRLAEYYAGPGRGDEMVLELPKGNYSLIYRSALKHREHIEDTGVQANTICAADICGAGAPLNRFSRQLWRFGRQLTMTASIPPRGPGWRTVIW